MKIHSRLTEEMTGLIGELFKSRNVFNLFGSNRQSIAATIQRIAASGEPAAIPYLALFALGANHSLQDQAAQASKALLISLTADDLLFLDQSVRRLYLGPAEHYNSWINIRSAQLAVLKEIKTGPEAVLGVLSFHQNGYVREAAVHSLARLTTGAELPFLLIRLNDWVPTVRTAARQAIQARMRPAYAHFFGANISLVQRLQTWERVDHSAFLGWILEYLRKPECSTALNDLLNSPDPKIRKLIYRLLTSRDNEQLAHLLHRSLRDKDPMIRLWSVMQARKLLEGDILLDIVREAVKDKYYGVRSPAAYAYVECFHGEATPILTSLLMDTASSLRSIGRYYLGKSEAVDFRAFYKLRLKSDSITDIATSIRGLGEVGNSTDANLLISFANHPSDKIRAATVHALAALDCDRFIGELVQAMLGALPGVSKEAARALSKRAALVDQVLLWEECRRHPSITIRKRILSILFNTSKWDGLHYAIAMSEDSAREIAEMAQNHILRWIREFNRSSIQPTKDQNARVRAALAAHASVMAEGIRRQIEFFIGQAE